MVDVAFEDFLDSDDDEFFLEASNHLLDNDFSLESTAAKKKNISEQVPQKLSKVDSSCYFKSVVLSGDEQDVSDKKKSSNISKEIGENTNDAAVLSLSDSYIDNNKSITIGNNGETVSSKTEISNISVVNKSESANKNEIVATTSSDCDISMLNVNSIKAATPANSSYINNRFTPGYTPKAKKRKILGPAGFLEFFDGSKETTPSSPDKMSMDMEFQNIVSSQYTPEHLSLTSWQKLQATVSSCSNLHSTAKYYSIQRVLLESSKKKLPKHMVVPVLCVLLKKLSTKGPTVISVFMDDTGEINGKIDTEVLSKYKEYLIEGTALILKNVTFLCNVLILKEQNLVSLYHPEGIEKHPQTLQSVLETSEPLKPMNCECLKLSHMKKDAHKTPYFDTSNHHTSKCVTHNQSRLNSISYQSKPRKFTLQNNSTSKNIKSGFTNPIQNKTLFVTNQNNSENKSISLISSQRRPTFSEASVNSQSMRSDEFLEQLLDGDNCMDDFDELLGNLDEKSFMEDL